jgi:tetratricopeptide (TPR) repeat protein
MRDNFTHFWNRTRALLLDERQGEAIDLVESRFGTARNWASLHLLREEDSEFSEVFLSRLEYFRSSDVLSDQQFGLAIAEDLVLCSLIQPPPPTIELMIYALYVRTLSRLGCTPEVIQASRRALSRARKLNQRHDGHSLAVANMFGLALHDIGRNRRAELVLRWTERSRREHEPGSIGLAYTLQNLGQVSNALGKTEEALLQLHEALVIKEGQKEPDNRSIANTLALLAGVQIERGQTEDALARYKRALGIRLGTLAYNHPDILRNRLSLADLLLDLNESEEAEDQLNQCDRILSDGSFRHINREIARYLNLRAHLLSKHLKPNEQIDRIKALADRLKALPNIRSFEAVEMANTLAFELGMAGKIDDAIAVIESASATPDIDRVSKRSIETTRANLLVRKGDFGKAKALADRILTETLTADLLSMRTKREALLAKAGACDGLQEWAECRDALRKMLHEEVKKVRARVSSSSILRASRNFRDSSLAGYARYLSLIEDRFATDQVALAELEETGAEIFGLETVARQFLQEKSTRMALSVDDVLSTNLEALSSPSNADEILAAYVARIEQESRADSLKQSIGFGDAKQARPPIPDGHILVQIFSYPRTFPHQVEAKHFWATSVDDQRYAALLTFRSGKSRRHRFLALGGQKKIANAVQLDRFHIIEKHPTLDTHALSELFCDLVSVVSNFSHCTITPDGYTWFYPLFALRAPNSQRVIDTTACCVAFAEPAGATGDSVGSRTRARVVTVGDVSHDLPKASMRFNSPFPALDSTKAELDSVSRYFPNAQRLERDSANMATVVAALQMRPDIFHFAGHGFAFPLDDVAQSPLPFLSEAEDDLLRCGLALAGCNGWSAGLPTPRDVGTGLLLGIDISILDLQGVGLVILSGCSTALGTAAMRDGMNGLAKAFQLAGVASVIASLWEVPDKETGELFDSFYRALREGANSVDALRLAQLSIARNGHPLVNWGAFVHYGHGFRLG